MNPVKYDAYTAIKRYNGKSTLNGGLVRWIERFTTINSTISP